VSGAFAETAMNQGGWLAVSWPLVLRATPVEAFAQS
jgi:hypothetical protein